jgi:hypothetical protein
MSRFTIKHKPGGSWLPISSANAFFILGISVAVSAFLVLLLRFQEAPARTLNFAGTRVLGAQSAD